MQIVSRKHSPSCRRCWRGGRAPPGSRARAPAETARRSAAWRRTARRGRRPSSPPGTGSGFGRGRGPAAGDVPAERKGCQ
ncbi:hypothetical protein TNIN_440301 [Trichonephila inaurata madagascariensis]|uniref:Uncharacterized protein n=1 Tax=Trichonephila inaurata madagascariensis TaxID=2747483 RepID=A0A8X6XLA5_9ARAC|nr:hypothetical protein TNIN_440301 [Trichonephila inaurata madagascariensis]